MIRKMLLGLAAVAALAGNCPAQNAEPNRSYKFDFVVKEVEGGKTVNSRNYMTTMAVIGTGTADVASIRTGSRVPVQNDKGLTYFDVGVNIDCRSVREIGSDISLFVSADISSLLQEQPSSAPVVRQNKWTATVLVPLRKPTVIFASDDPSSKRQMQLELTVTR